MQFSELADLNAIIDYVYAPENGLPTFTSQPAPAHFHAADEQLENFYQNSPPESSPLDEDAEFEERRRQHQRDRERRGQGRSAA